MPYFANDNDRIASLAMGRWVETARQEIDDIGGWREAVADRDKHDGDPRREWQGMPERFLTDTITVSNWVVSRHPQLDSKILHDVYQAVSAWRTDHSADRIAEQNALESTLDRAMFIVTAASAAIDSRLVERGPDDTELDATKTTAQPDYTGTHSTDAKYQRMLAEIPLLPKDESERGQKWQTQVHVANEVRARAFKITVGELTSDDKRKARQNLNKKRRPENLRIAYSDGSACIDQDGRRFRPDPVKRNTRWYLISSTKKQPT